jgi:hypothetical protein
MKDDSSIIKYCLLPNTSNKLKAGGKTADIALSKLQKLDSRCIEPKIIANG